MGGLSDVTEITEITEITALSLNCWGLKHLSALRTERLTEIGRRLAVLATPSPSPVSLPPLSIVALQECWCHDDFAAIHRLTRHVLPHAKFFHSGVWGAGLAVLSRWPIVQTGMLAYPLNGRPTAFWRGDWFVGKGLASATVRVSSQITLEVLVTHTHAPYEAGQPHDSYLVHQLAQTWEVGKRMRAAAERGRLVLAMGDFNMTPDSLPYQMLLLGAAAGAGPERPSSQTLPRDTWRELHPDASLGPANHPAEQARQRRLQQQRPPPDAAALGIPSAAFNLAVNGATSDNVLNTWRWPKDKQKRLHKAYQCHRQGYGPKEEGGTAKVAGGEFDVPPDTSDPRGKRLDYIFYTSPCTPLASLPQWRTKTAQVAMVEPHATLGCSVSDHFAVQVTLAHRTEESASPEGGAAAPLPPTTVYDEVLLEASKYMDRERFQRRWRGIHFFVSVAITIGCYVAVWFSPRAFVAFLLMLLASLGLVAGTIDGLLSLLFFGSEMRSLQEFYEEMTSARHMAGPTQAPLSRAENKA